MPCVPRRLLSDQRGQTAAEYMGVLVLVGLIIAAIAASPVASTISSAIQCEIESITSGRDRCERSQGEAPSRQEGQRSDGEGTLRSGAFEGPQPGGRKRLEGGQAPRTELRVAASLSATREPAMVNASFENPGEQAGSACAGFARVPFADDGPSSGRRYPQAGACEEQLGEALDRLPSDQRRLVEEAQARALEDRGCIAGSTCRVEQILHVRYHVLEDVLNTPAAQRGARARALAEGRQQVGALRPPPPPECDTSGVDGFLLGDLCLAIQNLGEGNVGAGLFHGALAWPGGKPFKILDEGVQRATREGTEEAAEEGAEEATEEAAEQAARQTPSQTPSFVRGTQGNAGPVPESVAEKLRGRAFSSRAEFRETFWKTVADDPELAAQFKPANVTLMRQGKAPYAVPGQRYGGHEVYVLHHRTPVSGGGSPYDPGNIMVVTPRYHQEVLDGSYHFGRGD